VSEGIDFSDSQARGVVVLGIPYPSVGDVNVTLKKRFNDERWALANAHRRSRQPGKGAGPVEAKRAGSEGKVWGQ
jgi:Rad3-related DNA helicase